MGRELRTRLSQVRPDLDLKLQQKRAPKKDRVRMFKVGEQVRVLDFRINADRWSKGVVTKVLGPVTYQVAVDSFLWKRHVDQIRKMVQHADSRLRLEPFKPTVPNTDMHRDHIAITDTSTDKDLPNTPSTSQKHTSQSPQKVTPTQQNSQTEHQTNREQILRRSKRQITKPDRLNL
nr:uncharacterized protein LOC129277396 [Lytechinus pictus]